MYQPELSVKAKTTTSPLAVIVLVGLVIAYFAAIYYSAHTQIATELTPKYPDVMQNCIYVSLLAALGCAALIVLQTDGAVVLRILLVVLAAMLGFAVTFQVSIAMTNVAQMRADFPADKTQTYATQWPVIDAYRNKSKSGTSYSIRTPTLSGSLKIEAQDFNFARANVTPQDIGMNGDQILSNGHFCANVVLQRAGDAIRLMVGPGQPLPAGSIGLCSQSAGN